MNFKYAFFTLSLAMTSFSLSAQIYTPLGAQNSAAITSNPTNSIGINTGGNNKGTLHIGKSLAIYADNQANTSFNHNVYLNGSTYKILRDNRAVNWSGVGYFRLHNYGFSFSGVNFKGDTDANVPKMKEIMRINYNGTVGINIDNAKAKLHVNGTSLIGDGNNFIQNKTNANGDPYRLYVKGGIITEEMKVELAPGNWADYVFADDYELKSLEEVEATIETQGHLHNIESAEKLEKEGLELKSITINQQEKIEELFLHMIEMDKRMKNLEIENADLKTQVQELSK